MTRRSRGFLTTVLFFAVALVALGLVVDRDRLDLDRVLAWVRGEEAAAGGTFWCPMDPSVVRPRSGTCPICSMELVPFEGGGSEPGVLQLTDRQVQQAGVRLATVERLDLERDIDATGRLEVDMSKRHTVVSRLPGKSRVERLLVYTAGDTVREGTVLAELRNPEATELLEQMRDAIAGYEELRREGRLEDLPDAQEWMDELRARFVRYGIPGAHVNVLAAKPRHLFTEPLFPVLAPFDGTLLADPLALEGATVEEGMRLFELADLTQLWLYVDLYEHERSLIERGQRVEFTTRAVPGQSFRTSVRFVDPIVQARTRTVRARCRVGSANGQLAPGMFVRARLLVEVPGILAVPESAVLQSGRRNVVLVSEGAGRFRPRMVDIGRRHLSAARGEADQGFAAEHERYHEVLAGLEPGDSVVVAGAFLLNAEAQFQGILKKMFAASDARDASNVSVEMAAGIGLLVDDYDALARALVADELASAAVPARAIAERAAALAREDAEAGPLLERLATAARELAAAASPASGGEPDADVVRLHFGSVSREVVAWLRDRQPHLVAEGELFVFRCPMADDFGFDLWVQRERELQNPYMGQMMPECGMPAELK